MFEHLAVNHWFLELALLRVKTWSHGLICPRFWWLGVGFALTVRQFHPFFGYTPVLGFSTSLRACARLDVQRCVLANQRQQA
jgi:hypothetical protein